MAIIQGFFFDLDGTLVNTYEADYLAYRDAIKDVTGWDLSQPEYSALHGMEIGAKLAKIFPAITQQQITSIRASKKLHYANHVHKTELNEGLVRFLARSAAQQHCVLVTTAKKDNAELVMQQHDLAQYFSFVVNGDDVKKHKPDPEAYMIALKKTGLQPHEAIAFEDSLSGVRAAEAAGIPVVHVREYSRA